MLCIRAQIIRILILPEQLCLQKILHQFQFKISFLVCFHSTCFYSEMDYNETEKREHSVRGSVETWSKVGIQLEIEEWKTSKINLLKSISAVL